MMKFVLFAACVALASGFSPAPHAVRSRMAMSRVAGKPVVMSASIEEKVKAIIAEQLGVDAAKVTPDASNTGDERPAGDHYQQARRRPN